MFDPGRGSCISSGRGGPMRPPGGVSVVDPGRGKDNVSWLPVLAGAPDRGQLDPHAVAAVIWASQGSYYITTHHLL